MRNPVPSVVGILSVPVETQQLLTVPIVGNFLTVNTCSKQVCNLNYQRGYICICPSEDERGGDTVLRGFGSGFGSREHHCNWDIEMNAFYNLVTPPPVPKLCTDIAPPKSLGRIQGDGKGPCNRLTLPLRLCNECVLTLTQAIEILGFEN